MSNLLCGKGKHSMGSCGIGDVSAVDRTGELGIMIGNKEFWNRGLGTEAVRLLLRLGTEAVRLLLLRVSDAQPEQHQSHRALVQRTRDPLLREVRLQALRRLARLVVPRRHTARHRPDVPAARRLRRGIAGAQEGLASHCIRFGCNMDAMAPY